MSVICSEQNIVTYEGRRSCEISYAPEYCCFSGDEDRCSASNEKNCRAYEACAIVHDGPGIVDGHGGCEHLRSLLGIGTKLEANELIWMTDRTLHEALSQRSSGNRQFFRMVTSRVSHWFADHCTPNPRVSLPDHVIVVHGNKFDHLD